MSKFSPNLCLVRKTSESLGITSDKIANNEDTCSLKPKKFKRRPRDLEFAQDMAFSDDESREINHREIPLLPKTHTSPVSQQAPY